MQLSESPFDVDRINRKRIEDFKEYVWYNSEVCNGCYSRVRSVGPEVTKTLQQPDEMMLEDSTELVRMDLNQWYQRTDIGSQEHSSFDSNRRFGTCYCTNCGSDCSSFDTVQSKDRMMELAERIAEYANKHTPLDIDDDKMVRETGELKSVPVTDGWDTEILAVAFSRAVR